MDVPPSLSIPLHKTGSLGAVLVKTLTAVDLFLAQHVHVSHVRTYGRGAFPYVVLWCGTAAEVLPTAFACFLPTCGLDYVEVAVAVSSMIRSWA